MPGAEADDDHGDGSLPGEVREALRPREALRRHVRQGREGPAESASLAGVPVGVLSTGSETKPGRDAGRSGAQAGGSNRVCA
eukprot:1143610-Pyramimonas_sp.AAC.1